MESRKRNAARHCHAARRHPLARFRTFVGLLSTLHAIVHRTHVRGLRHLRCDHDFARLRGIGRALAEKIARLDIRAPVSGIVLGLQVTTLNSVIRPAEPVLYLIPQDRPLIIVAQIPPIHVDEVHVGQAVHVIFAAFSARTTPQLQGKLLSVSADAMSDQATKSSFYRAEIVLNPGELEKLAGQTVIPGMPVQAYISTGNRSPMAYLLKPFMDYFHMAFRES